MCALKFRIQTITFFQNTDSVLCAASITSHCPAHGNHIVSQANSSCTLQDGNMDSVHSSVIPGKFQVT